MAVVQNGTRRDKDRSSVDSVNLRLLCSFLVFVRCRASLACEFLGSTEKGCRAFREFGERGGESYKGNPATAMRRRMSLNLGSLRRGS